MERKEGAKWNENLEKKCAAWSLEEVDLIEAG
jgi:hypothetical protein